MEGFANALLDNAQVARGGGFDLPEHSAGHEVGRFGPRALRLGDELNVHAIVGEGACRSHLVILDVEMGWGGYVSLARGHGGIIAASFLRGPRAGSFFNAVLGALRFADGLGVGAWRRVRGARVGRAAAGPLLTASRKGAAMTIDIPLSRKDEELDRIHQDEKREHREDIQRDEHYTHDDEGYHAMKEAKEVRDARLGHEEKAERREQDVRDAELAEEANAVLDPQNQ